MEKGRSKVEGFAQHTRDGWLYGLGYGKEEISRPYVAIVNSWNEYNPGHVNLREVAERVKQGVREAGGLPFEVGTTGICDGMVWGNGTYVELPSRNLVADEVELNVEGNRFDAMVLLGGCDSIVPGMLMAAARLDIPTIMVTPGYMPNGCYRGREVMSYDAIDALHQMQKGEISREDYEEMLTSSKMGCGSCTFMATGRSMCCIAEAMGLTMPGNATMDASDKRLGLMGYEAGKRVMEMLRQGVTARRFITRESIENAIIADLALAGSVNLMVHIPAIAYEAGLDADWWGYWDKMSHKVPLLLTVKPNGAYTFKDFHFAGGMKGFMATLLPHLHADCPTVTGKNLKEVYENAPVYNRDVIHSLDNPVSETGGIAVLRGNIAPEGCVVRVAACPPSMLPFKGTVKAFEDVPAALKALHNGGIEAWDAIIVRNQGPRRFNVDGPARVGIELYMTPLFDKVAVISDGEFSGGSKGLIVGFVSPECAAGGPMAIAQTGDKITIDVETRSIDIDVSDEEIARRLRESPPKPLDESKHLPMLCVFARNITSTAKGCAWERRY